MSGRGEEALWDDGPADFRRLMHLPFAQELVVAVSSTAFVRREPPSTSGTIQTKGQWQ